MCIFLESERFCILFKKHMSERISESSTNSSVGDSTPSQEKRKIHAASGRKVIDNDSVMTSDENTRGRRPSIGGIDNVKEDSRPPSLRADRRASKDLITPVDIAGKQFISTKQKWNTKWTLYFFL